MFVPLPRDANGKIQLPGRPTPVYEVWFNQVTALPAWLTEGGTGTATVASNVLTMTTGASSGNRKYLHGPAAGSTVLESYAVTIFGMKTTTVGVGATTVAVRTNGATDGVGARLHSPEDPTNKYTHLRDGVAATAATDAMIVDNNDIAAAKASTRTIIFIPKWGMCYAVEDETEVMHARDISASMVAGTMCGALEVRNESGGVRTMTCEGIRMELRVR